MRPRAGPRVAATLAVWLVAAGAIFVAGVPPVRADPSPRAVALALGVLTGLALVVALTGGAIPLRGVRRARVPAVTARSAFLVAAAIFEEAIWRGLVFARLLVSVGPPPAFGLATAGFALAHWPAQRWRMLAHVLTGGTFAALYYATGRLGAAVAAHGTYNVVVGLAVEGGRSRRGPPP